jgi:hypothetical protein
MRLEWPFHLLQVFNMPVKSTARPRANLCRYCSGIIPFRDTGHTTRLFHSTLEEFLQQSELCDLCAYIRIHLKEESGLDEEAILYVRLLELNEPEHQVRWALLELSIRTMVSGSDTNYVYKFSIATSRSNCALSPSIITLLTFSKYPKTKKTPAQVRSP